MKLFSCKYAQMGRASQQIPFALSLVRKEVEFICLLCLAYIVA